MSAGFPLYVHRNLQHFMYAIVVFTGKMIAVPIENRQTNDRDGYTNDIRPCSRWLGPMILNYWFSMLSKIARITTYLLHLRILVLFLIGRFTPFNEFVVANRERMLFWRWKGVFWYKIQNKLVQPNKPLFGHTRFSFLLLQRREHK